MRQYKFTKSVCERYDVRFGGEWATFTIDEKGGLFNCQSSYGNYSYAWPRHGRKTFKHFILELARDRYYFLNKVSNDNVFNFDASSRMWKKQIIKMRKNGDREKEDARVAWDYIDNLDPDMSYDRAVNEICASKVIRRMWREPWESMDFVKEYPREAVIFATEVMPMFAEILRQELSEAEREAKSCKGQ